MNITSHHHCKFCGNDPETLLASARIVEKECDAIDINLGCPQNIAKRGYYGAYLQDEWNLISSIGIVISHILSFTSLYPTLIQRSIP